MSGQDGLVPTEGVDEGSADSTVETTAGDGQGAGHGGSGHGGGGQGGGGDVVGEPGRGEPDSEDQPAGPLDMETAESRTTREQQGPGQQLAEGEG